MPAATCLKRFTETTTNPRYETIPFPEDLLPGGLIISQIYLKRAKGTFPVTRVTDPCNEFTKYNTDH